MNLSLFYQNRQGGWTCTGSPDLQKGLDFKNHEIAVHMTCRPGERQTHYTLEFTADYPTRLKLEGSLPGANPWHLIPGCIIGDNNLSHARPGQYPNLTAPDSSEPYSSPIWELRADRAPTPVSMLFTDAAAAAISIDPYGSDTAGATVRNGVFSELPNRFGVTLGYANLPCTFVDKTLAGKTVSLPGSSQPTRSARTGGVIYHFPGHGRACARKIIEQEYRQRRDLPEFKKNHHQAARALLDCFVEVNWSDSLQHYTNQSTRLPEPATLKPWRPLVEIAWTGGAVLAFPFLLAEEILQLPKDYFQGRKNGRQLFDEIAASFNPASGLFYDLTQERNGSRVNGWWSGILLSDRHCAYTNGQALYYLFQALHHLRDHKLTVPAQWEIVALSVARTLLQLQREDGNCGYAYSLDQPEVTDWEGFAGCWVAAAFAAAYSYTRDDAFKQGARRGIGFYHQDVQQLHCWGTPMDTWKSPDQEGNLAFLKAARILHQTTGEPDLLEKLEDSAHYEYLWRYGFKARPELLPLLGSNWNSCGGSITSVSNPHLHPMGLLATEDLHYLAEQTGNPYHRQRAEDGLAFAMNCLELYPDVTGYGRYGILTERFCPSDGLTTCEYNDGRRASMWFSYNGWAAANVLEALLLTLGRS